ncbi:hypothetical protein [Streptomyces albipurpureus]|uniref:Uncharacterized protein n=1 Tax=Streptomyces albipurpureus TaxID=2897419 RepID=A0ABT0UI76_9ACTN|nr:hypothetical protein [Streptomyces sp. CWNU-1]MCM2388332.1 hypothetical protein [Streptomyces sp. CWNU-1]
MADSERSQDPDDELPEPWNQDDNPEEAAREESTADQRDHDEPDRGIASRQFWNRLVIEIMSNLVTDLLLELIKSSGG